jgi:hypothetical protein
MQHDATIAVDHSLQIEPDSLISLIPPLKWNRKDVGFH